MQAIAYIRSLFSSATAAEADGDCRFIPECTDRYFRSIATQATGQVIGDDTAVDLDLNAVFDALDRTTSRVGQQYLYARMRLPAGEADVAEFIGRTALFEADPALAKRCSSRLQKLVHDDAYDIQDLIFNTPQRIRHIGIIYTLTAASLLSLAGLFMHALFIIPLLAIFCVNIYLHYSNKIRITLYLSAVTQLRKCICVTRSLANEPTIAANYDTGFLPALEKIERRSRVIGVQGGSGNDFAAIIYLLLELVKITCNAEILLFHHFIRTITEKRPEIQRTFRFTGDIDAAISLSRLKSERPTCRPEFIAGKYFETYQIVHPLIADCRPNTLRLEDQSLLLTGSNMSGKTTFIRTLAINALLGQTLGICFAESFKAPYLRIHTSIRVSDDIESGTSYYLAEVLAIRRFLQAAEAGAPCLFVLDELFKGTNTTERIAAGKAVLARLNANGHLVCAATHDTELTDLLNGNYALYHFCEEVRDGQLEFDYRLHEGRLKTRNAIRILELYGYPPDVVADAYSTQEKLA